jgi:hypothetical protein
MYKPIVVLTGIAALMLGGSMAANAASVANTMGEFPRAFSPVEKIGCTSSGDKCPYGYRIEKHGGKGWSCERCGDQKQGSRYRDWNDRYNEPRRYREYGDYGPRRYRDYDERYYQPRYNREY